MSALDGSGRRRRRGAGRRRSVARTLLALLAVVLAFLLGVAFARTLDERPEPGEPVTTVRTLAPVPEEAPVSTLTVTVTQP